MTPNPLLSSPGSLPLFDQIQPEHIAPALGALLAQAKEVLRVGEATVSMSWCGKRHWR